MTAQDGTDTIIGVVNEAYPDEDLWVGEIYKTTSRAQALYGYSLLV